MRMRTNEEEDRYDQEQIDLATTPVESQDRRDLIEDSNWNFFLALPIMTGHDFNY